MTTHQSVLMVNPPDPPGYVSNKDSMGGLGQLYHVESTVRMPPIDIPYTASCLRSNGIPVDVIESHGSDLDLRNCTRKIEKRDLDRSTIIAVRTSVPTIEWDLKVVKEIREVSDSRILMFGPYMSICPGEALSSPFVDGVIRGEPEVVIPQLAKEGLGKTRGVVYKRNGKLVIQPAQRQMADLNSLPYPAWDLLPYDAYNIGSLVDRRPFLTALTSRGCPFSCIYCPYHVTQGREWRHRTPENVVRELKHLYYTFNMRGLLFRDPEFALSRQRVSQICRAIVAEDLDFHWRCETRVDDLSKQLVKEMARAGCVGINIGIESAEPKILKNVGRKPFPMDRAKEIVKQCRKSGIQVFAFFVVGLPGETKKSIMKTISVAKKLRPDFTQFTVATPYPGTRLQKWALSHNFLVSNLCEQYTGFDIVMRNEHLSQRTLRKLVRLATLTSLRRGSLVRQRLSQGGVKPIVRELLLLIYEKWIKTTSWAS